MELHLHRRVGPPGQVFRCARNIENIGCRAGVGRLIGLHKKCSRTLKEFKPMFLAAPRQSLKRGHLLNGGGINCQVLNGLALNGQLAAPTGRQVITIITIATRRRDLGGVPLDASPRLPRIGSRRTARDDDGCCHDDVIVTMFGLEGSVHCDNVNVSISIRMPHCYNVGSDQQCWYRTLPFFFFSPCFVS